MTPNGRIGKTRMRRWYVIRKVLSAKPYTINTTTSWTFTLECGHKELRFNDAELKDGGRLGYFTCGKEMKT